LEFTYNFLVLCGSATFNLEVDDAVAERPLPVGDTEYRKFTNFLAQSMAEIGDEGGCIGEVEVHFLHEES
jgi:hypothetical protein